MTHSEHSRGRGLRIAAAVAVLVVMAGGMWWVPWESVAIRWHLNQARAHLAERQDFEALARLRLALRRDLNQPDVLLSLARTHRRLGQLAKATSLLEYAAACGAETGRVEREKLLVLAQSGNLQQAEPFLSTLLVNAGEDGPDICQAYVQGYFSNLRTKEALDLLDAWEQAYPADAEPVFMRAYLWHSMSRWDLAIPLYRQGLAMAPDRTLMRRRLAEGLLATHELDAAEQELVLCQRENSSDAQVHLLLAHCDYEKGQWEQASGHLDDALRLAPDHIDSRRLKGQLLLAQGQLDGALRELQWVVDREPYDTFGRDALGRALRALGRSEEAQPHLDYVAQAEGELRRVDRLVRESITAPQDAELRFQIGATLFKYGPPDDAARWMTAALEIDPAHRGAHEALARYFEAQGDASRATLHRQLASAPRQP